MLLVAVLDKDTITDYFTLLLETLVKCDILKLDSNGKVIQESMKQERVYLADETGWDVCHLAMTHKIWMYKFCCQTLPDT